MPRKCSAKPIDGFILTDNEIQAIYESSINEWANGGAYIPIPKHLRKGKKVYVVIKK